MISRLGSFEIASVIKGPVMVLDILHWQTLTALASL